MIYAEDITKYTCTTADLEERIMFWVAVAGKNANTQAHKLDDFLTLLRDGAPSGLTPFQLLRRTIEIDTTLLVHMRAVGLGKYTLMDRAYTTLAKETMLDLRTCTVAQLETFPGIGPKTARCFVLHSRKGARVAGLDRHVMRYMMKKGLAESQVTPGSPKEYARIEALFLAECDKYGMEPAEFDLMLWKIGAKRPL